VYVRHCPECQTDYRPDIAVCADCGGPLVDHDDDIEFGACEAPAASAPQEVPEGFEALFTAGRVHDLKPVADRLIEAGIECRLRDVRRGCSVVGYRLLAHTRDHGEARTVVADLAGVFRDVADAEPVEGDSGGYTHCPACGTALRPGAASCSECELPLAESEPVCPQCGQPLDLEGDGGCSRCGPGAGADE
jgi:predicted amidophosphoribosyltransferase